MTALQNAMIAAKRRKEKRRANIRAAGIVVIISAVLCGAGYVFLRFMGWLESFL